MPNYQAISLERHGPLHWKRFSTYAFAAADSAAPLTIPELPKAVVSMPTGFVQHGEDFALVAVLGLSPGMNLFVAQDWRWLGQYIPAVYRSYPFRLAPTADGKQVLCVDEDSGLVTDGSKGESFFSEEDQPARAIQDILNFLTQLEQSRLHTVAACAALQKHKLIRPWTITVKTETGEQQATGLFQIDEVALNQLSGDALLELRQTGALLVAYCQLLSMQHLPVLGQLAEAHAKASEKALAAQKFMSGNDLDLSFFNKNGTISFAGLD